MTCRLAGAIDIARYLDRPDDPEHVEFHRHVLACAECRERVYLGANLARAALESTSEVRVEHPEPMGLVAYAAGALEPDRRVSIDAHLAACGYCRDELTVLQRSTSAPAPRPALPAKAPAASQRGVALQAKERLARLRDVFWRPVLGYALAGLLLIANVLQPVPPEVRTLGDESLGSVRLAGPQPIAVSESSETSSLEIPLEPGSKSSRFRIQLSNATRTRELVDERTPDEPGDVLILALAPGWLKADRYEISVDELEPRQRRVGSFQIVVEP